MEPGNSSSYNYNKKLSMFKRAYKTSVYWSKVFRLTLTDLTTNRFGLQIQHIQDLKLTRLLIFKLAKEILVEMGILWEIIIICLRKRHMINLIDSANSS